jgi:hypothetical protein
LPFSFSLFHAAKTPRLILILWGPPLDWRRFHLGTGRL